MRNYCWAQNTEALLAQSEGVKSWVRDFYLVSRNPDPSHSRAVDCRFPALRKTVGLTLADSLLVLPRGGSRP